MGDLLKLKSKKLSLFFIPYFVFLIGGAALMFCWDKEKLHLWFNQYYCQFCDEFFKIFTFAGNGIFTTFVILLLLFHKIRSAIFLAIGAITTSIVVNILKHLFFKDTDRPAGYFTHWFTENRIRMVPDYDVYTGVTFPSGHAAIALMMMLTLAIIVNKKWASILFIFIALLIAYSRIYLSQHFFADIYFGSITGVVCCLIAILITNHNLFSKPAFNQSILSWLNKKEETHV